jgi:hypothetical protein
MDPVALLGVIRNIAVIIPGNYMSITNSTKKRTKIDPVRNSYGIKKVCGSHQADFRFQSDGSTFRPPKELKNKLLLIHLNYYTLLSLLRAVKNLSRANVNPVASDSDSQ